MDKRWDGKFSNLKISEQGFPELFRELERLHHKERSDRLRSLAMIGLYSLYNIGQNNSGSPVSAPHPAYGVVDSPPDNEMPSQLDAAKKELKGRLLGSVEIIN
ncbi:hypothetical protein [Marinobacterium aestuariivivens]|uniref:Uncharacterized protein n=1 Tax=Marinobacterium aestuariivivens TaxID=1698799 RepID=A0ABW2A9E3_9GAMM